MKNFILDKKPEVNENKLTFKGIEYHLIMVRGNGCFLRVYEKDILKDEIAMTKDAMRAFHMLLSTE